MPNPAEIFQRLASSAENDPWPAIQTRIAWLTSLRDTLSDRRTEIRDAVWEDFRKSPVESDLTELIPVLLELRTALKSLKSWVAPRKLRSAFPFWGLSSKLQYNPKGVVLVISPWNYPVNLSLGPLVSALAAGNRVIIKPSERVPKSSGLIARIVEAALPKDVASVVEGGPEAGAQLLDLPFDHFYFTGGQLVGREVMRAAARHLSTATLELGGKSPAIVDGTVGLTKCAEKIIRGKFLNGGQTCIAPDYVVVHDGHFDALIREMLAQVAHFEKSTEMASPVDRRHAARLDEILSEAVRQGAVTHPTDGGRSGPTIVTGVPLTSRLMQEEIFGPILPVLRYRSYDELLGILKTNPTPLTMYLFTKEEGFTDRLTMQLKCGSICINETLLHFVHPRIPFGGVGTSGFGRGHGRTGFETFSNAVPSMRQNLRKGLVPLLYPPGPPYKEKVRELLFRILRR